MGQWAKGKMKEIKGLQYRSGAAIEGKSFAEIGVFGWIRENGRKKPQSAEHRNQAPQVY